MAGANIARSVRFAALLASAAAVPAPSAAAQRSELARCLAIADIAERVRCYDALARAEQGHDAESSAPAAEQSASPEPAPVTSAPPAPPSPAPVAAAPPPAPAAAAQREEFGLSPAAIESRRPTQDRQLDEISTTIASARTVGAGYWQFVTDEGAVWRLTEVRRSFRPPEPGDDVVIRRGTLGSYYLDVDDQPALPIRRVD
jgi:hypothetical protein